MARVLCVIVRLVLAMLVIAMTEIFFSTTIDHKHNPQHDVSECVTTYLEINVRTDVDNFFVGPRVEREEF